MNFEQLLCCLNVFLGILFLVKADEKGNLKVIYAVNAGSNEHIDKNGIQYEADPLRIGTASDYGNHLMIIGRAHELDEILYRTERYHTATFGYDLPIAGDGEYALILKFCEVYFNEPHKKVFDVKLNKQHTIVSQLDIFHQVGRGTAHDEYVFFAIVNGRLYYKNEISDIFDNMISLEFIKGDYDNPKINAFALLKGDVDQIPRLPPLLEEISLEDHSTIGLDEAQQQQESVIGSKGAETPLKTESYVSEELEDTEPSTRQKIISGPRKPSPYSQDESSSIMLPVFIAVGAFIPLLFCLCKL